MHVRRKIQLQQGKRRWKDHDQHENKDPDQQILKDPGSTFKQTNIAFAPHDG